MTAVRDPVLYRTEAGGFRGPREVPHPDAEVSVARRAMHQIGGATVVYLALITLWWLLEPQSIDGLGFGVVAVGVALALANLISLFVLVSLEDDRPDSRVYMAELAETGRTTPRNTGRRG